MVPAVESAAVEAERSQPAARAPEQTKLCARSLRSVIVSAYYRHVNRRVDVMWKLPCLTLFFAFVAGSTSSRAVTQAEWKEVFEAIDSTTVYSVTCNIAAAVLAMGGPTAAIEKTIDATTKRYKTKAPFFALASGSGKDLGIDLISQVGASEITCDDLSRLVVGKQQSDRAELRIIQGRVMLYAYCPASSPTCQQLVRDKVFAVASDAPKPQKPAAKAKSAPKSK